MDRFPFFEVLTKKMPTKVLENQQDMLLVK